MKTCVVSRRQFVLTTRLSARSGYQLPPRAFQTPSIRNTGRRFARSQIRSAHRFTMSKEIVSDSSDLNFTSYAAQPGSRGPETYEAEVRLVSLGLRNEVLHEA